MFSLPIKVHEPEVNEFLIKRLNILDPLNNKNNLGRSVSKGIGSAFFFILLDISQVLSTEEVFLLLFNGLCTELEKYKMMNPVIIGILLEAY